MQTTSIRNRKSQVVGVVVHNERGQNLGAYKLDGSQFPGGHPGLLFRGQVEQIIRQHLAKRYI